METQRKGATHYGNTPTDNAGAKVQNIPDTHKDITEVLTYFQCISGTSLDCALSTGILRNSVTYHIDTLLKMGLLQVVKIAPDVHTGHKAQWYSADPSKWQKPRYIQLSLFEKEA